MWYLKEFYTTSPTFSSLQSLYEKMGAKKTEADEEMSDAIPFVAEILRLTDPSMMSLVLGTLVNNFPDVTKEHLMAILYLRSDVRASHQWPMVELLTMIQPSFFTANFLYDPLSSLFRVLRRKSFPSASTKMMIVDRRQKIMHRQFFRPSKLSRGFFSDCNFKSVQKRQK